MTNLNLVVYVRLHDGRYHGTGERYPSPARLFQALVAGLGLSGPLGDEDQAALRWLEDLSGNSAPIVALPHMKKGKPYDNFVPNNDLDSQKGDFRKIGKIRTEKEIRSQLFDASTPLMFAWQVSEEDRTQAERIREFANCIYQFGRGVDLAWAWGELIDDEALNAQLSEYAGLVFKPTGPNGQSFACPATGSLKSLIARHDANKDRFDTIVDRSGRSLKVGQLVRQRPKPWFKQVAYNAPPTGRLFELRESTKETPFAVWPQTKVTVLVEALRDKAVSRLKRGMPEDAMDIVRYIVGQKPDGKDACPTSHRVRIIPIPSIGSQFADHDIRRVYIEVPAECMLRADDVFWSFSGLTLDPPTQNEAAVSINVVPANDTSMLQHYAIVTPSRKSKTWQTVAPAALPESGRRRRIDPDKLKDAATRDDEAKGGTERRVEQLRAAAAVIQALRHAGVSPRPQQIIVQREPFEGKGQRAEEFAAGTRFSKHQLWHVAIEFDKPVEGPLVFGNGRFLGLGIMAPVSSSQA